MSIHHATYGGSADYFLQKTTTTTNSTGSFTTGTDKTAAIMAGVNGLANIASSLIVGLATAKAAGKAGESQGAGGTSQSTSLADFQNTIFQQNEGKISKEALAQIYKKNDTDGVEGLSQAELQKANADVSKIIQEAIKFGQMTPEQQAADVRADLETLMQQGKDIKVENGKILIDGEEVSLKDKGATDASVKTIVAEVEKFLAEKAGKTQDE